MAQFEGMTALVVDDQVFIRRTVGTMLSNLGFRHVAEAEDGASALEAYAASLPDVVLCDIHMGPVDGMVFLRALREEERRIKGIAPVIFMTANAEAGIVQQARDLRVDAFLVKPVQPPALTRQLERVLAPKLASHWRVNRHSA